MKHDDILKKAVVMIKQSSTFYWEHVTMKTINLIYIYIVLFCYLQMWIFTFLLLL